MLCWVLRVWWEVWSAVSWVDRAERAAWVVVRAVRRLVISSLLGSVVVGVAEGIVVGATLLRSARRESGGI